jgi:hypothetical protein
MEVRVRVGGVGRQAGHSRPRPPRPCPPLPPPPPPPQVFAQFKYFLADPVANDVKYQASAQPFLVLGLLTTGLAVGHHNVAALLQ